MSDAPPTIESPAPSPEAGLAKQVICLAASLQCLSNIDTIARHGRSDMDTLHFAMHSLFKFKAGSIDDMVEDPARLETGLRVLADLLRGDSAPQYVTIKRYFMGVAHIQQSLRRNQDMSAIIRSRLEHAEKGINLSGFDTDTVAAAVAGIYQDTLSHLRFRVQVKGSAQQLGDARNAARIRSLLFAAVRFLFLWRQEGGKRMDLIFRRRRILGACERLLQEIEGQSDTPSL